MPYKFCQLTSKGPCLPCVSMVGRALLAGYPRYMDIIPAALLEDYNINVWSKILIHCVIWQWTTQGSCSQRAVLIGKWNIFFLHNCQFYPVCIMRMFGTWWQQQKCLLVAKVTPGCSQYDMRDTFGVALWWHMLKENTATLIARFMGPIWGRQDPGGPHVDPMNFAIWDAFWLWDIVR